MSASTFDQPLSAETLSEVPDPQPSKYITIIEPQRGWVSLNLPEVWRYRDLLFQMIARDFSAKYRQTVLGVLWAVINPLIQMMLYTFVFGKIAKFDTGAIPYPVFCFAGLLPWMYFSSCLSRSSTSAMRGATVMTKVYFPRLILPLTTVASGMIDFVIQLGILLVIMLGYGIAPGWGLLLAPFFLIVSAITALSVGLWVTALGVKYRDINNVITFGVSMWMWLTPVVYPLKMVPQKWRLLFSLNPMTGVVEGFRWALLGMGNPNWLMLSVSSSMTAILFIGGLYFFRRCEASFADVI